MIKTSSIWENRKIVTMIVGDVSAILRNSDGIGYPVNWVTQDCSCSYFVDTGVSLILGSEAIREILKSLNFSVV